MVSPQRGDVVEADVGDGAHSRLDDVRGIKPAAQSDFHHLKVRADAPEMDERHRRHRLECGNAAVAAIVAPHLRPLAQMLLTTSANSRSLTGCPLTRDALGRAVQVRRGVQPDLVSLRGEDGSSHSRGAALALRAGDMHRRHGEMRVVQAAPSAASCVRDGRTNALGCAWSARSRQAPSRAAKRLRR